MSKERLEELETKYSTLTVSSEKNGTEYTEVDIEDLVFLIQNGFKQAERVQELEKENNQIKEAYKDREEDLESMREMLGIDCGDMAIELPIERIQGDKLKCWRVVNEMR